MLNRHFTFFKILFCASYAKTWFILFYKVGRSYGEIYVGHYLDANIYQSAKALKKNADNHDISRQMFENR